MKLLGLTGGIGAGKSTAAEFLRRRNIPVVDTDAIAFQLVQPGQPALLEIFQTFGDRVRDEYGRLRRHELAALAFSDAGARKRLETILHPRIREVWLAEANRWLLAGKAVGVVVIPLLYETGATQYFFATICCGCTAETQKNRLLARGWDSTHVRDRVDAQLAMERKLELADFVLWTEGGLDVHEAQLDRILQAV